MGVGPGHRRMERVEERGGVEGCSWARGMRRGLVCLRSRGGGRVRASCFSGFFLLFFSPRTPFFPLPFVVNSCLLHLHSPVTSLTLPPSVLALTFPSSTLLTPLFETTASLFNRTKSPPSQSPPTLATPSSLTALEYLLSLPLPPLNLLTSISPIGNPLPRPRRRHDPAQVRRPRSRALRPPSVFRRRS
jgi:hypothetical protein